MNQIALPLPLTLDQQCADAQKRLQEHINRSAGQHQRAIRRAFVRAHNGGLQHEPHSCCLRILWPSA